MVAERLHYIVQAAIEALEELVLLGVGEDFFDHFAVGVLHGELEADEGGPRAPGGEADDGGPQGGSNSTKTTPPPPPPQKQLTTQELVAIISAIMGLFAT